MKTPITCDFFLSFTFLIYLYICIYISSFPFVWLVVVGHKLDYTPSDGRSKTKKKKLKKKKFTDCGNTDFAFIE